MTKRDKAVIWAVYSHRALTTPQIELLLFRPDNGQRHRTKTSRVRHRLKLLTRHGYLFRDEQPTKLSEGRKPYVYFLNHRAVKVLIDDFGLFQDEIDWKSRDNNVKWLFLNHLLATNDVRVAIEAAAEAGDLTIDNWLDDHTLKRGGWETQWKSPIRIQ